MADTVWKWPLLEEFNLLSMPAGAEVLTVAEQHGQIVLWARVNPDSAERERRRFHLAGTGTAIPDVATAYVGTGFAAGGALVFHVFEEADRG